MPPMAGHGDEVPEIAGLLLAHFVERGEVPLSHFSSGALNALRTRLERLARRMGRAVAPVKNLALSALEEEISAEDVHRLILQEDGGQIGAPAAAASCFDQPLREAREAFERMYFEYHLRGTR